MAQKQELEITISETGEVHINVQGGKGSSCINMTRDIEEALGVVSIRELKSSYYEKEHDERIHQENGDAT